MKNLMKIMVGLLLSAVLVMTMLGCPNGSADNIQGWWKYTTSLPGSESSTYIEYDSSGKILRAGSTREEYKDGDFDTQVKILKYDILKQSVGQYTSFTKIDKKNLPSWANGSSGDGSIGDDYNDLIGRWESDEESWAYTPIGGIEVHYKLKMAFTFDTKNKTSRIVIKTDSSDTSVIPNEEETFGPYNIISTSSVGLKTTLQYLDTVVNRERELVITFTDNNKNAISVDTYAFDIYNKK